MQALLTIARRSRTGGWRLPFLQRESYMCRAWPRQVRAAAPRDSATHPTARAVRATRAAAGRATRPRSSRQPIERRSVRPSARSLTPAPGAPKQRRSSTAGAAALRPAPPFGRLPRSGSKPPRPASSEPARATATSPRPCAPTSRRCARRSSLGTGTCGSPRSLARRSRISSTASSPTGHSASTVRNAVLPCERSTTGSGG